MEMGLFKYLSFVCLVDFVKASYLTPIISLCVCFLDFSWIFYFWDLFAFTCVQRYICSICFIVALIHFFSKGFYFRYSSL